MSSQWYYQQTKKEKEKMMVFGGTGFIGSAVCRVAAGCGYDVTVVTRATPRYDEQKPWQQQLTYLEADVNNEYDDAKWTNRIPEQKAVVSCLGAFAFSNAELRHVNGYLNERIARRVEQFSRTTRFVFVGAHSFILPRLLLRGYYYGKEAVENLVPELLPRRSVVVKPSFVYGLRNGLDLGLLGRPLAWLANRIPHGRTAQQIPLYDMLCVPPVALDSVANAVVVAAMRPQDRRIADQYPVINAWRIQDWFSSLE